MPHLSRRVHQNRVSLSRPLQGPESSCKASGIRRESRPPRGLFPWPNVSGKAGESSPYVHTTTLGSRPARTRSARTGSASGRGLTHAKSRLSTWPVLRPPARPCPLSEALSSACPRPLSEALSSSQPRSLGVALSSARPRVPSAGSNPPPARQLFL